MNRELLELLRRVEEGARRLAATIVHCYDKPIKDIELARSDLEEITSALNSFKAHVAQKPPYWGTYFEGFFFKAVRS